MTLGGEVDFPLTAAHFHRTNYERPAAVTSAAAPHRPLTGLLLAVFYSALIFSLQLVKTPV